MGISTKLVSEFTDATHTPTRRDALAKLIKTKQLQEAVTKESFRHGLKQLASSVRNESSDVDRLLTVAALLHVAATAPSIRASVESLVRDAIVEPLSKLSELPDVHDRLYAARSWRVAPKSWRLDDLATAAAHEESGEAVRRECIAGVIGLAAEIQEAIAALRRALVTVRFETKKPGDSLGRRLNRVLVALTEAVSRSDKPVGAGAGREIGQLVNWRFRAARRPESPAVCNGVAEHVAALTHAIIRADFSHGGSGRTYDALSIVSDWFATHEWHAMCMSSTAITRVREDLKKAILLLAGAGKTDGRLRDALVTVAGSRKHADAICRTLAMEHPAIPDDVRDWLAGSSPRVKSASATESQERSIDEVVAELLVAMTRLSGAAEVVKSGVIPEVSIVLPQSVHVISRLIRMTDAMANKLSLAVAWRSLRMRGVVGQEVEFSPVEHQFNTRGVRSRRVRLLSPVVERVSEDGVPRVVLKASVEPTSDQRESAVGASA